MSRFDPIFCSARKVTLPGIVAGAILAGLAWIASPALAETNLKFAHFAAETHPGHIAAQQFAQAVEARTGGEVTVTLFPANQLGSPPEQLEQTKLGAIDMNLPTHGGLDKYEKAFATVMTPFAFRDYQHAHEVLDGPFTEWVAPKLEDQGLIMLSHWEYGFRNVTNNVRPVNSPADMEGLKMRTPPEVQLVAAMEALGASATQIAFPELPNALNQGVVDGQENPVGVIYHYKVYDFQKHLALTKHSYNSMIHVVSKDSWEKLTPEQQAIVREESAKAGALMRKLVAEQEAKDLEALKEAGMEITTPELSAFADKMAPAYERVSDYAGKENFDKFIGMIR